MPCIHILTHEYPPHRGGAGTYCFEMGLAASKLEQNIEIWAPCGSEKNDSFDVITMWHVLEHVYNLKEDVNQICNILKPNGFLYIAVPNRSSWDAGYYNKYWAAYDVPRHLYHFRKEDVVNLFNSKDLQLKEVIPMKFDAYYVSMLSEKYKKGSFIMGFWNGLRSNIKSKKGGYSSQVYVFEKND